MVTEAHAAELLLLVFLPLATAMLIAWVQPPRTGGLSRWYALAGSVATFVVAVGLLPRALAAPGEFTAGLSRVWIPGWGIRFFLAMDGLSGLLVTLTNLLTILGVLASWSAVVERRREFYALLMLLQTGMVGTFLALDLFLFYIFWELMLVPLYFLIGIFGSGRRVYATLKFFLYTMAGSVLMLIGILALYFHARPLMVGGSFALPELAAVSDRLPAEVQRLIFAAFLIAFAIKIPLVPFHTWLPDAHTEAPTAGSILLAGVLLKTGVYGLMRFAIPFFPSVAAEAAPWMMTVGAAVIIYGALTALAQEDVKRLVAYSSVSHMGFVVLGLFAFREEAVAGAALQMVNHGLSTGGLFFCVGVLYERRHTRRMSDFGGLARNMKLYATLTLILILSSIGLPGLNGFVGEFLILVGTFKSAPWRAAVGAVGVILAAVYLLRLAQQVFFGPLETAENAGLRDLNPRETFALGVLVALAFWIGLYPRPYLDAVAPLGRELSAMVEAGRPVAEAFLAGLPARPTP